MKKLEMRYDFFFSMHATFKILFEINLTEQKSEFPKRNKEQFYDTPFKNKFEVKFLRKSIFIICYIYLLIYYNNIMFMYMQKNVWYWHIHLLLLKSHISVHALYLIHVLYVLCAS